MKIIKRAQEHQRFLRECYYTSETYQIITSIDENETIVDMSFGVTMVYDIDEAKDLVKTLRATWPDYAEDPYYHQGETHLVSTSEKPRLTQDYKGLKLYRRIYMGEAVYGVIGSAKTHLEGAMDAWEQWLADRQLILQDAWAARNEQTIV